MTAIALSDVSPIVIARRHGPGSGFGFDVDAPRAFGPPAEGLDQRIPMMLDLNSWLET